MISQIIRQISLMPFTAYRRIFLGLDIHIGALLAVILVATCAQSEARPKVPTSDPDVYFLSIGIERYFNDGDTADFGPNTMPFANGRGPVRGARRVAEELRNAGARYGILLTAPADEKQTTIGQDDIVGALFELKDRIRRDGSKNPRIIFYFSGHAVGDRANSFLYAAPGNLVILTPLGQKDTMRLIKTSLWSYDILSALVQFRVHPTMQYLDHFIPSQVMGDPASPASYVAATKRAAELVQIDEDTRARGLYPPEGNAPVPFLALFDNCYRSIDQNLSNASGLNEKERREFEEDGMVFYAAHPGEPAMPVAEGEADDPISTYVGPLAKRVLLALKAGPDSRGFSFRRFRELVLQPLPDVPIPYGLNSTTAEILALPLLPSKAKVIMSPIVERRGTVTTPVRCCGLLDR